jgi:hypothetical protein
VVSSAQMIITRWGEDVAVSLSSPQLPGIVAAFDIDPSPSQVMEAAVAAGLDPDGNVQVHTEEVLSVDDCQYFVRIRHDFHANARANVAQRIIDQILNDADLRDYAVADEFGDALFIAALPTDTIGMTLASAAAGQPVTVSSVDTAEERVHCISIVRNAPEPNGPTLEALGLSERSTVHALLEMKSRLKNHSRDHELVQA